MQPASSSHWRWPVLVSAAIIVVAGGFWYGKLRPRASAAEVQDAVALYHPGSTVGCAPAKSNGSLWGCAVIYRAESQCVAMVVSVTGHIARGGISPKLCSTPSLARLAPHPVTATAVAADVGRTAGGGSAFTCARTGHSGIRWACARTYPTRRCVIARVVQWKPIKLTPSATACASPARSNLGF